MNKQERSEHTIKIGREILKMQDIRKMSEKEYKLLETLIYKRQGLSGKTRLMEVRYAFSRMPFSICYLKRDFQLFEKKRIPYNDKYIKALHNLTAYQLPIKKRALFLFK